MSEPPISGLNETRSGQGKSSPVLREPPISDLNETPKGKRLLLPLLLGGGALLLVLFLLFFSRPAVQKQGNTNQSLPQEDQSLKIAQDILSTDTDLMTCKNVLQQMNNHLATHPDEKPGSVDDSVKTLCKGFGFKEQQFNEVDSPTFTLLDGHYLEECMMLREVARFLEPPVLITREKKQSIASNAMAAFDWTNRQIRQTLRNTESVPPVYALRRGWAGSFERSLVFFSLLKQFYPPSGEASPPAMCLIFLKTPDPKIPRFWAGVVNEAGNDIYLFDPVAGIPLPGGQNGQPLLLTELKADPKKLRLLDSKENPYDVQPEFLSQLVLGMVPPISSLAPRMKLLEDKYLPAGRKARLYVAINELMGNLEKAARPALGPSTKVELFPPGVESLRLFFPQEEGGFAPPQRYQMFQTELIPQTAIPPLLIKAPNELILQQFGNMLAQPFIAAVLGGKLPRDLMIHARYAKAVPDLVREGDELRAQLRAAEADPMLPQRVTLWLGRAGNEYQNLDAIYKNEKSLPEDKENGQQRILNLWKDGDRDIRLLIAGTIARPRGEQIAWMLALCKHELALQQERRFLSLGGSPPPQAVQDRLNKWKDAESAWRRHLEDFPTGVTAANAQLLRGKALVALGDTATAVALWSDLSRQMYPQEKCARLFLANSLKK